jgi:hypothetical protein
MTHLEQETIMGYNTFIKEQKEEGPGRVTLVLFDDQYDIVYEDIMLHTVPKLTDEVYYARGYTALRDAVGRTIAHVRERHMKDRPNKTIVFITTDGEENASKEYTQDQIREMVDECEEDGWIFFFMGANIDAFDVGMAMGMAAANIATTDPTKGGTQAAYAAMASMSASAMSDDDGSDQSLQDVYNQSLTATDEEED